MDRDGAEVAIPLAPLELNSSFDEACQLLDAEAKLALTLHLFASSSPEHYSGEAKLAVTLPFCAKRPFWTPTAGRPREEAWQGAAASTAPAGTTTGARCMLMTMTP